MSFILDALRKSESERRRSAAPMLAGVPVEATRPAVPVWLWVLIGLLAVAVVVLGGAWWTTSRTALTIPTASVQPAPTVPAAETLPAQPPASSPVPTGAAPAEAVMPSAPPPTASGAVVERSSTSSGAPPSDSSAATASSLSASAPASAPASDAEARPTAPPAPANIGRDAGARPHESLPTVAEASAAGVNLPLLTLELHVYHDQPASRWVYVNGARYTEGRRLASGPELVEIVPEGIVIRQAGREFLLLAQ